MKKESRDELEIMRENFINLRKARGWSIEELSKISGICAEILTDIERGEDFDVWYLFKLCSIYQKRPDEMFFSNAAGMSKNNYFQSSF